jgi:hypothetical protein
LKKTIGGLVSILFVLALLVVTGNNADAATYIGAKKCKACHMKQFKSWKKTPMAGAFENLKPGVKAEAKKKAGLDADKDYTHDAKCLKCHTTGYGKDGGFTSIEETPKLAGVQCEGCHGPGGEFSKFMKKNQKAWKTSGYTTDELKAVGLVIPSEDEAGCKSCHNDESPFNEKVDAKYKFDFKEMLEKSHEHFPLKYKKK